MLLGLYVVAAFLAGTGLILSAALKTEGIADKLLAWNPKRAAPNETAALLAARHVVEIVSLANRHRREIGRLKPDAGS
jgi:hypothetical protein